MPRPTCPITSTRRQFLAGAAALPFAGPAAAKTAEVLIFAAASLQDALADVLATVADHRLRWTSSFASSAVLARQIEAGAGAEIFISANARWMDHLGARGHLMAETRRDLLGNRLVVVAPAAHAAPLNLTAGDLAGRLGNRPFAMGFVDAVPAGIYGKQALETLGLWEELAPRVAQTDNVRAALALVARGEAPLGIVYASDARADPRVHAVATLPEDSHDPVLYSAALLTPRPSADAETLFAALTSPDALPVFARHGFIPPPAV
ncbi:MAG: molybdate ABC transporter substrate-binding protein [Pseudomonadota bacterium]